MVGRKPGPDSQQVTTSATAKRNVCMQQPAKHGDLLQGPVSQTRLMGLELVPTLTPLQPPQCRQIDPWSVLVWTPICPVRPLCPGVPGKDGRRPMTRSGLSGARPGGTSQSPALLSWIGIPQAEAYLLVGLKSGMNLMTHDLSKFIIQTHHSLSKRGITFGALAAAS